MTVVIDCNVFVICLTSSSPYHQIYQKLIAGEFNLAGLFEILLEYEEVIQKKYSFATASALMALLKELPNVQNFTPHYKWNLIHSDSDDNKYCHCCIAAGANFLVSEDQHFNVLKNLNFPKLNLLSIKIL